MDEVMSILNADNLRKLKRLLIASLATKLDDLDVDFKGIHVRTSHHDATIWIATIEFESAEDKRETYQHAFNPDLLVAYFEEKTSMAAKMTEGCRKEWLTTPR